MWLRAERAWCIVCRFLLLLLFTLWLVGELVGHCECVRVCWVEMLEDWTDVGGLFNAGGFFEFSSNAEWLMGQKA